MFRDEWVSLRFLSQVIKASSRKGRIGWEDKCSK
jgi:hypothetical protein